jgi:hypothetical protein
MKGEDPSWKLKQQRCPCFCGGEGFLVFITCPACGHIAVVCDEVGTVFPNPRDLNEQPCGSWLDWSGDKCPKCREALLSDFRYATGEKIQSLGFTAGDYD